MTPPSNEDAATHGRRTDDATSPSRFAESNVHSQAGAANSAWRRAGWAAALLLVCYLMLTAVWAGLGFLVTGPLAGTWVGTVDQQVTTWLVENRTPILDGWSHAGSMLADTMVKIIVTAVIAIAMLVAWRSLREPFLVCFALILEAAVFITVTFIVGRPRPDVQALDEVSVGTSFPSGHVAAAMAYSAIAVIVFERTRNAWIRAVTVTAAVAIPVIVGISRMYRGVHYLTDVVAGMVLGAACVVAVYLVVRRCFDRRHGAVRSALAVRRAEPDRR